MSGPLIVMSPMLTRFLANMCASVLMLTHVLAQTHKLASTPEAKLGHLQLRLDVVRGCRLRRQRSHALIHGR